MKSSSRNLEYVWRAWCTILCHTFQSNKNREQTSSCILVGLFDFEGWSFVIVLLCHPINAALSCNLRYTFVDRKVWRKKEYCAYGFFDSVEGAFDRVYLTTLSGKLTTGAMEFDKCIYCNITVWFDVQLEPRIFLISLLDPTGLKCITSIVHPVYWHSHHIPVILNPPCALTTHANLENKGCSQQPEQAGWEWNTSEHPVTGCLRCGTQTMQFEYLGSVVSSNNDARMKVNAAWLKRRQFTSVLRHQDNNVWDYCSRMSSYEGEVNMTILLRWKFFGGLDLTTSETSMSVNVFGVVPIVKKVRERVLDLDGMAMLCEHGSPV